MSQTQMTQAAPLVSQYLHHSNHVVRYQAIWFLGCWGRMSNYLDQIIQSAETDPDLDNRAFAARCSGLILKSHQNPAAMRALLRLVNNENGSADLRCAAYSALIYGYYGENGAKAAHEFDPIGTKSIADFDIAWLTSVANWVDGLNSDTEVGTIEGRSH
ncbi:HEAT repeat domain-containing protein [Edaphobacter aggregans]|uniref:HEAT repeat domain-containing protein n=1 Tax=Edaphobacter aggregans TaxID=570835 RepID=UPI00054E102E|nr:HEAT repeat domain-containing protein [Edaphobacter aggregans]